MLVSWKKVEMTAIYSEYEPLLDEIMRCYL